MELHTYFSQGSFFRINFIYISSIVYYMFMLFQVRFPTSSLVQYNITAIQFKSDRSAFFTLSECYSRLSLICSYFQSSTLVTNVSILVHRTFEIALCYKIALFVFLAIAVFLLDLFFLYFSNALTE